MRPQKTQKMVRSPETGLTVAASVEREFCIRNNGQWCEENASSSTSLERIATELKELKEQIGAICAGDVDNIRKWRIHTQTTHPLSAAPKLLREQFNCNATSQAYCKFLEILVRYPRLLHIHPSCRCLRSFHLCEAPGHFISVLDRFLCTFYSKMDWFWEANSFNPHYEGTSACDMLLEDEIILGQPERWRFGKDDSGDITKWDDDYVVSLTCNGCFNLVTADGSLYTQDLPSEQESKTLPLLESEFRIALQLLANGGSLIVKIYTTYLPKTRLLISSVVSRFDDAYLFKPMSSKGGNNERYLICMGFNRSESSNCDETLGNSVLLNCEAYFSGLQSSFIRANLDSYNTITKAEVGRYRDHVLREFHKRALTNYIGNPLRVSHLNQEPLERPWIGIFGQNYVETLRRICDEQSAVEFLKNFHQCDVMTEHEAIGNVEVEFAENELEFLEWPMQALLDTKVIVTAPPVAEVLHSLFAPPGLLRSLKIRRPEALIDLCSYCSPDEDDSGLYVQSLHFSGVISVDAYRLRSQKDWCYLLSNLLKAVREEKISELKLLWSASSIPLVLSRFSASVIAMMCVMFFQFRFGDHNVLATFSKPNYSEDIPPSLESYLSKLTLAASSQIERIHCFVPTAMLAMLHPYLLDLNRRQWQVLLSGMDLSTVVDKYVEA
ncbi:hypothetical protein V3C99_007248 [Haemonchus contortus]